MIGAWGGIRSGYGKADSARFDTDDDQDKSFCIEFYGKFLLHLLFFALCKKRKKIFI